METKQPVTLKIAAILLLILAVVNLGAVVMQQYGWLTLSGTAQNPRLQRPGNAWNDGRPRDNRGWQNLPDVPQDRFRPGNFAAGRGLFSFLWLRLGRLLRLWWNVALLALAILAAVGLWKGKSWGTTLAVVLAALVLLAALFGLFSTRLPGLFWPASPSGLRWWPWLMFGMNLGKVLLTLALLLLVLLTVARQRKGVSSPA